MKSKPFFISQNGRLPQLFALRFLTKRISILGVFVIFLFPASFYSCCLDCSVKVEIIGQENIKNRFNTIGILGEQSDTAYVEVWYSEAAEGEENRIVHEWVKPPVIIGGHYAYVTYNLVQTSSKLRTQLDKEPINDFSDGGSHYMKVVNHGSESIEYFIVGTHPVVITDLNKEFPSGVFQDSPAPPPTSLHYDIYPRVLYKNASVYFLLYPQEKPKSKQHVIEYSIYEGGYYYYHRSHVVNFEGNRIGDLIVENPWTIEQVMDLYRQEYTEGIETLVLKYKESSRDKFVLKKSKRLYYGFIPNGASLQSGETTPFITNVCGDNFVCFVVDDEY